LTGRNDDYVFYVEGRRFRFGRERNGSSPVAVLTWGENLLSFQPQVNLAKQVKRVEIYGWDPVLRREIVGRAGPGDEPGREGGRRSGAERIRTGREPLILRTRRPVYDQAEADGHARALLKERADDLVRGDGECLGLPVLRPDRNVLLDGLGRVFSRPYYLEEVTHRFDGNGYRTRFKVKETTI
jgi:phage protein D